MTPTPTTKAGKALRNFCRSQLPSSHKGLGWDELIAAIEAEAVAAAEGYYLVSKGEPTIKKVIAAERARIAAAVEATYGMTPGSVSGRGALGRWVSRSAVLAIVNPEPKEER